METLKIDGNYLEGGGQIVRTSLSLSVLTGKKVIIENIRAGRPQPGLKEQHLQAVKTMAKICNAKENSCFGCKELVFEPGQIKGNEFDAEIRTAGSTALLFNTVMPLVFNDKIKLKINGGGTWNKFAPSVLYLEKVLLPLLKKFGVEAKIHVNEVGFYPTGQAKVEFEGEWKDIHSIDLTKYKKPEKIKIYSVAEERLKNKKVAERQADKAEEIIKEKETIETEKNVDYVRSDSLGSGLLIKSESCLASDSLGEKRKTSEKVAQEAAKDFLEEIKKESVVDKYGADQLMVFMALSSIKTGKENKIKTSKITNHAKTNAYVIEKFLPVEFSFGEGVVCCRKKIRLF